MGNNEDGGFEVFFFVEFWFEIFFKYFCVILQNMFEVQSKVGSKYKGIYFV